MVATLCWGERGPLSVSFFLSRMSNTGSRLFIIESVVTSILLVVFLVMFPIVPVFFSISFIPCYLSSSFCPPPSFAR